MRGKGSKLAANKASTDEWWMKLNDPTSTVGGEGAAEPQTVCDRSTLSETTTTNRQMEATVRGGATAPPCQI